MAVMGPNIAGQVGVVGDVAAQVADDEFDGVGDDVRDALEGQAVAVVQRPRGVGAGQAQHHRGGFCGGLSRRSDGLHRSPDRVETFGPAAPAHRLPDLAATGRQRTAQRAGQRVGVDLSEVARQVVGACGGRDSAWVEMLVEPLGERGDLALEVREVQVHSAHRDPGPDRCSLP